MAKFFKHQMFLASHKDSVHDKVLEAQKDTFTQSLELAQELEAIQSNHECTQKIAAVKVKLPLEEANAIIWDHLTKAENNRFQPKNIANGQACSFGPAHSSAPQPQYRLPILKK